MTWTWTKHIDRGTAEAIRNPSLSAFGAVFCGFFAGLQLFYITFQDAAMSRTLITIALDCFLVVLFLTLAIERSYFLAKAIRQLRSGVSQSSVS